MRIGKYCSEKNQVKSCEMQEMTACILAKPGLYLLAGRSGAGKTTLMRRMVSSSEDEKIQCLYVDLKSNFEPGRDRDLTDRFELFTSNTKNDQKRLVVIDYLQLLEWGVEGVSLMETIKINLNRLLNYAMSRHLSIVVMYRMSRRSDGQSIKQYGLDDIRDVFGSMGIFEKVFFVKSDLDMEALES